MAEFQGAIEQAFAAWEVPDPETGLSATFTFVPDLSTPGTPTNDLRLASGVTPYPGAAISGADVLMANGPEARWTLERFQFTLAHELGHALGLVDVNVPAEGIALPGGGMGSLFLDDDYDGSTSETALATPTNSFAQLIDPFDPDGSPGIIGYEMDNGDPGLSAPGADILMEAGGNDPLIGLDEPMQPDDFAGRQFLYPLPEASGCLAQAASALWCAALAARRRGAWRPASGSGR